jgi:DNA mismatch repair protein MutS2
MDPKSLHTLEYFKILERLAGYCAFAASADKARALRPTTNLDEARRKLALTSEAVQMLVSRPDLTIGGARDVRSQVDLAAHGAVLTPPDLLDVKSTLIAARTLARTFERLSGQFPNLTEIAAQIPSAQGLVDSISKAISERGEIMDSASEKLGNVRRELRITRPPCTCRKD